MTRAAQAMSRTIARSIASCFLALALLTLAAPVHAQESAEALVERAITLREAGDDLGARTLILRAYTASPTPRTTAQLGLVEQALGLWVEAETHLVAALGQPRDAWIAPRRAVLEQSLQVVRSNIGSLQVLTSVPGATIAIGGVQLGVTPLAAALRYPVGTYSVDVMLDGYRSQTVTMVVRADSLARQLVTLLPAPAGELGAAEARDGRARRTGQDDVEQDDTEDRAPVESDGGSVTSTWWFWTIIGAVVVGTAVGIGVGVSSSPGTEQPLPGADGVAYTLGASF